MIILHKITYNAKHALNNELNEEEDLTTQKCHINKEIFNDTIAYLEDKISEVAQNYSNILSIDVVEDGYNVDSYELSFEITVDLRNEDDRESVIDFVDYLPRLTSTVNNRFVYVDLDYEDKSDYTMIVLSTQTKIV